MSRDGIEQRTVPDCFGDLNLDQIVTSIIAGRDEYDLRPIFYAPLDNTAAIDYRHEVMRDLEDPQLVEHIDSFAQKMRGARAKLAQSLTLDHRLQKQRWFIDAVKAYVEAASGLSNDLADTNIKSPGLVAFRSFLIAYTDSTAFTSLCVETQKLDTDLARIRYSLHIEENRIRVSRYKSEADYGEEVLRTFEKFKQGTTKGCKLDISRASVLTHIEAAVLERVAWLHPDVFLSLNDFCARYCNFLDATVQSFDREIQFYIAFLHHIERLKAVGLEFCYPEVDDRSKEVCGDDVFDLALANVLVLNKTHVVTNSFYLNDPERILVISGPNQGGKTTFARTFGQLHYLARLGYLVPGRKVRLFLFDRLFTHFEREEDLGTLTSKLEEDLRRIFDILEQATAKSILIMNESLGATTLHDGLFLSKEIIERISKRDTLCVYVTFLDELATLNDSTVGMFSTVDPENPAARTFKLIRGVPNGLAYAVAIAQKYRLTRALIKERFES
jgi:hypothetical protein